MYLSIKVIILPHGKIWRVICPAIWQNITLLLLLQDTLCLMRNHTMTRLNNYWLYIFEKYTLCHTVFCHIINAFSRILKYVDIFSLLFKQLEVTNSIIYRMLSLPYDIAYKIFENHLIHVNVMHNFWRSEILYISSKICSFQVKTVYVFIIKYLLPLSTFKPITMSNGEIIYI